jgi:hypothetical protein
MHHRSMGLWLSSTSATHSNTRWLVESYLWSSLGDQFARWTSASELLFIFFPLVRGAKTDMPLNPDDIFKSTVHRAVNRSGVRRYSIPLFFGTDYNVRLEVCQVPCIESPSVHVFQPIPSCVSDSRPAKYDVVTAGEYVKKRFEATYGH